MQAKPIACAQERDEGRRGWFGGLETVAKGGFTFEKQNVNTGRGLENVRVEKLRRLTPWPPTRDQGGLKGKSLQRPPSASGGCFSRAHAGVETPSEQRGFKAS